MSPNDFIRKWSASTLKERSAAQEHFIDLCHVLGEPTPGDADPHGEWFCFERGAKKIGGGDGWADVWRRHHFAWEYKGKHKDLGAALAQLYRYAVALENPPLVVVSDMETIEIHTNFTNTVAEVHQIRIAELASPDSLQKLKCLFTNPERLRPGQTKTALTEAAADRFARLAEVLRKRGGEAERVAHFLNRILFCLFAQHAGLLPPDLVVRVLESGVKAPDQANRMLKSLFAAMKKGGVFGTHVIEWFNGGLFDSSDSVPLTPDDIKELLSVAALDWSAIEPSIFGTLFERGLDPGKRSQIGAHYTKADAIMKLVTPVVVSPLATQWDIAKREIRKALGKPDRTRSVATKNRKQAQAIFDAFLYKLAEFRVLDPACGSGNFLYIALQELKNLEHRATLEAEQLGLEVPLAGMHVGVQCVRGIELNTFAAELARVTVWIGEIQWMLQHGIPPSKNPILKPLETIECRDAVLAVNGSEPQWPESDVIIGNPPFLGNKKMNAELGEWYAARLRRRYRDRVPAAADLVCYWFEKARAQLESGDSQYAGLVGTNSIRHGANRAVLDRITRSGKIFEAWSDQAWINEGAAVRVSLVAFATNAPKGQPRLDNVAVPAIHSDLTAARSSQKGAAIDLTKARRLPQNGDIAFMGVTKVGPFDVPGTLAREWLLDANPHGRSNADVLRPSWNGLDVTRRPRDVWIIDFGMAMPLSEAALYGAPFAWVKTNVQPERAKNNRETYRRLWWRHGEPRPALRARLQSLDRFIVTPEVAKHRVFVWAPKGVLPDKNLQVFTRDDDIAFGILCSRFHALWAARLGSSLEDRPRYTPTTTFETFPFPEGLTPNLQPGHYDNDFASEIGSAAARLHELREQWLNPPEWVDRVFETNGQYPPKIEAKPGYEQDLKRRTLTQLYNERPAWLEDAHTRLDVAVAAAYGWKDYALEMADDEILSRLLQVNVTRAADLFTEADQAKPKVQMRTGSRSNFEQIVDRRLALAGTIVSELRNDNNLGRTKLAKVFYLADASVRLNLKTEYQREAAGPLDPRALYHQKIGIESLARQRNYFDTHEHGRTIRYVPSSRLPALVRTGPSLFGEKWIEIQRVIRLCGPLSTEQSEIVATLHACWNDLLLDRQPVSDDRIVREFLTNWHEKKLRFSKQRLLKALAWMKKNQLAPEGTGKHTVDRPANATHA